MPKKSRKAKVRAAQRPIRTTYPVGPAVTPKRQPGESMTPRAASTSAAPARTGVALTFDYQYVYKDLRRIALLAATFFGLMFIVWFLVEVQGVHLIPGLL
jgi:hypothetical protein